MTLKKPSRTGRNLDQPEPLDPLHGPAEGPPLGPPDPTREQQIAMGKRPAMTYRGTVVPSGFASEQRRFIKSLDEQRALAQSEPIEDLQRRYGNIDEYTAGLFRAYHAAPSGDVKERYADMIRSNLAQGFHALSRSVAGDTERASDAVEDVTVGQMAFHKREFGEAPVRRLARAIRNEPSKK